MKWRSPRKRWLENRISRNQRKSICPTSYEWPENALIITSRRAVKDPSMFLEWGEALSLSRKRITILCHGRSKKPGDAQVLYFNAKPFGILGGVSDKGLKTALKKEYGLVVNYFDKLNPGLRYAAECSNARLKAGLPVTGAKYNHLTIDVPTHDHERFKKELIRYLDILTNTDHERA